MAARFTETELTVLDHMLSSDGFAVLEEQLAADRERLHARLERMGLPDAEANYIRGQLYTLGQLSRDKLADRFRNAREGPDA